jgi:RimJ/RimL family protein N-acetyltransferase
MIYELDRAKYDLVRTLFQPLAEHQPFCAAVLAGIHPGRVFVDDPHRPQAAFTSREDGWCFLAGEPGSGAFNQALNRAIFDRQAIPKKARSLLFTCHPQDWHGQLAAALHPRQPIPARRRHYVCRALAYDWRANLPEGFVVQRMDRTLLSHPRLRIPEDVQETIQRWRKMASPQFQDYGFVAIHDDAVVSWATVDAIVNGVGDAGLFTMPAYRRRGLATVTTAAAVEYGLSHGLSAVNWTCAGDNIGSIRTAERLGFERRPDYWLYCLMFDEAEHLGALAYYYLAEGHYQEATDLLEQTFALEEGPPDWAYYDAARAYAVLGNQEKAFEHLNAAVDRGWLDIEDTKEFESLVGRSEWTAVMDRVRLYKGKPGI